MIRKIRILLIAEAANPEAVSVPLVGWSFARALQEHPDLSVHIVTQIRNREAFLRAGLVEGQDFTAINSEAVARPLWKLASVLRMGKGKGWTMVQAIASLSYRYFEHLVWKRFGKELKNGGYDVVHRVTPLSPTVPSSIATKCKANGIPFVVGPLNGGVPWPKGFDSERRREREWLSYLRDLYKLQPGRWATLKSASAILVGSRHTQSEIPAGYQCKTIYMPENGIDPTRFNLKSDPPAHSPLRICFVGRLVPYKGADMLIAAASDMLINRKAVIEIIGDGPMSDALRKQVADLGVQDQVIFHGWKEHHDVQKILSKCHLLGFPSIREFGGGVVLEAMALGVPPLVVDYAGPGELVATGRGFKVPISTREPLIAAVRQELELLSDQWRVLRETGEQARVYVQEKMTWTSKAQQMCHVYGWILGSEAKKPELF
ncbi:glycosyltransferase family 4 protein [Thioclava kandeliae]|uniref:Glycosyltransferase family 4 protein n=1 Tax=Thioclava kandeliae TaxID=3070818 RepID=A0ABV1SLL0_9RHOB